MRIVWNRKLIVVISYVFSDNESKIQVKVVGDLTGCFILCGLSHRVTF